MRWLKKFKYDIFTLKEIYAYEKIFRITYPNNLHIKDKIRQTLQNLRDLNLLIFSQIKKGEYRLIKYEEDYEIEVNDNEVIYLITNESMPNWINIGFTNSINEKLQTINKNFLPTPFNLKRKIITNNSNKTTLLLSLISNAISITDNFKTISSQDNKGFYNISEE